ncbi:MAG: hypothetical protein ACYC8T_20800 [Myxococcaceae bacterium]
MTRLLRPSIVLSLLLFASGCTHHFTRAECLGHGGTAWREVTSAHFRLRTNLDSPAAREAVTELEKARKALLFAWNGRVDPPGRLDAVVLRSSAEFHEFADRTAGGLFTVDRTGPLLVLPGESYSFDASPNRWSVMHGLARHLSSYALARQPVWLQVGLGSYLEMTRPYGDGDEIRLGEAHPTWLHWAKTHARVPWEELWAWDSSADLREAETDSHYASSWLWVHFLLNKHPGQFADFQGRLSQAEEPREAWAAAFKGVDQGELERELNEYLQRGNYSAFRFPLGEISSESVERELSNGEVHALRARLFLLRTAVETSVTPEASANAEVSRGLQADPGNFDALYWQVISTGSAGKRLELARELVKRHPERAEGWVELTERLFKVSGAERERRDAAIKALQLEPNSVNALNNLAWDYVLSNQPKIGVPFATKAAKLAPWDAAVLDTYAATLAGAGNCPGAVGVQRRAIDMLRERAPKSERLEYSLRLARYEGGCQTAPTDPAS